MRDRGISSFLIILCVLLTSRPLRSEVMDLSSGLEERGASTLSEFSAEGVSVALESLRGVENLIIREFPGGAILQGELLNPEDMRHVTFVADALGNVLNLCTLHPEALRYAASHLNTVLENNRISGVTLSVLGKGLLLTGVTLEQGDLDRIRRICEALHIPLVDGTRPSKADPRMVLFEVSFTEVNTDAFREIGVKWPASSPLADPSGMRIGRLSPAQNLEIVIEHLIHEGKARIISRPRLVCGSGRVASFQAGGEIPIPRSDEEGRLSVTWKPYGIILEVEPILDPEGLIHTGIRSEVSMVDQANAIEGIPGILTRRVETHLSLTLRQTVVLSGLVHSDDAERITKIPLLGDIPVLGELFRSRSFQKRETELVVFLTPMALGDNPLFENDRFPEHTINGPDEKTGAKDKRR